MKTALNLGIALAILGSLPSIAYADVCVPFVQSQLSELSIPGTATSSLTSGDGYSKSAPYSTSSVRVEKTDLPDVDYVVRAIVARKVRSDNGASLYVTYKTVRSYSVFYMKGCHAVWADYGAADDEGSSTSNIRIEAEACSKYNADPKAAERAKKWFLVGGVYHTAAYDYVKRYFASSNPSIEAKYLRWLANTCAANRDLFSNASTSVPTSPALGSESPRAGSAASAI